MGFNSGFKVLITISINTTSRSRNISNVALSVAGYIRETFPLFGLHTMLLNWDSSVNVVTRLWTGLPRTMLRFSEEAKDFLFIKVFRAALRPAHLLTVLLSPRVNPTVREADC